MLYLFNGALWSCFQMKLRESFVAAEVRILAHAGNIVCIYKQLWQYVVFNPCCGDFKHVYQQAKRYWGGCCLHFAECFDYFLVELKQQRFF